MHTDDMERHILITERVIMTQTLKQKVDKEGKTSAAMVFTCLKLLISFKTFLKCNLRAFLTRAET